MTAVDPSAIGSDVARSWGQYALRKIAGAVVGALRLNTDGALPTEIVQAARPVSTLRTPHGTLRFRAGHGRIVWHIRSFYEEEPETVEWLDSMRPGEVLWDVGAHIGKYSLYAAQAGVRAFAFEPEPQNFALLAENVALNGLEDVVTPVMTALYDRIGFDHLAVPYVTRAGAYNQFGGNRGPVVYGTTLDALTQKFPAPDHLKIDVDGREREILRGGANVLAAVKSLLIELNRNTDADLPAVIEAAGLVKVSERSNWEYRKDRSREAECPTVNVLYRRP